jgi:hypothetical protein
MSKRAPQTFIVLALALLLAAGGLYLFLADSSKDADKAEQSRPAPESSTRRGSAEAPPSRDHAEPGATPRVRKLPSRDARLRLLQAIGKARQARLAGKASASSGSGSSGDRTAPSLPVGTLDKKYIQDTMREVVPLLKECYSLATDETPGLEGRLVVGFDIEGEPEIGGVVTRADVLADDQSPLGRNATLAECVRETVMSLAFAAPGGGGKVSVRYPFIFRGGKGD